MAVNRIQSLLREGRQPSQLDLSNERVNDVHSLFQNLEKIGAQLRTLTLRGNGIRELPKDLSAFQELITLDIRDNPFDSADSILQGLQSLPKLRYLYISMPREQEEDQLVVSLPKLAFLNGVELEEEPDQKLYGQAAVPPPQSSGGGPPPQPSSLTYQQPASEKNNATSVGAVSATFVPSASSYTQTNIQPSEQLRQPPSQGAEDNTTAHHSEGQTYIDDYISNTVDITLSEGDLENTALVYGALKSIRTQKKPNQEQELTERFDGHMTQLMRDLSTKLKQQHNTFLRQNEILQAKQKLPSECVKLLVDIVAKDLNNPTLAASIRRLTSIYDGVFSEYDKVSKEMKRCYQAKVTSLKDDLKRAETESAQLLEAAEALEQEAMTAKQRNRELEEYINQNLQGQQQDPSRKGPAPPAQVSRPPPVEMPTVPVGSSQGGDQAYQELAPKNPSNNVSHSVSNTRQRPEFTLATEARARQRGPKSHEAVERENPSKPQGGEAPPKTLSLNQLKDFIEGIYASKIKFDAKCEEAHLPHETLEQHMYTYLNQRYGLRSLILSYAAAIIRGVNTYSQADNDVRVFGCILRNEIDEDFRFVQRQLKDTVTELLKLHLKGRHPLKTDGTISQMVDEKMHGYVTLNECSDIVRYMYSAEDATELMRQLETMAASNEKQEASSDQEDDDEIKDEPKQLEYNTFLKVLLDFQLRGHLYFLKGFRGTFRQLDDDTDGVLNHKQFDQLVSLVAPDKAKSADRQAYNELLKQVDPFNSGRITFSQCVTALSSDIANQGI